MNKFILFLCLLCSSLLAEAEWSSEYEVKLKRNEVHKVSLVVGMTNKEVFFHWTLFVDGGLVFLAKYDGFNHQSILYNDYKKDFFKIQLSKEGSREKQSPYVAIFFKNYDKDKQVAVFKVAVFGDVIIQG